MVAHSKGSLPFLAPFVLSSIAAGAGGGAESTSATTCQKVKELYRGEECCGSPSKEVNFQIVPHHPVYEVNPCANTKPTGGSWDNFPCADAITSAIEQAGADVTAGYVGGMEVTNTPTDSTPVTPNTNPYFHGNLCPVNVHWHLGAEHRSAGQYDEDGAASGTYGTPAGSASYQQGSPPTQGSDMSYNANAGLRYGYACRHYDATDVKFTTEYDWQHCMDMHVGETYEVHWPHSSVGACGTPFQYQSPFYDGVFCNPGGVDLSTLSQQNVADNIGVQAQVFTIVNDEDFYYPDLVRGMIVGHGTAFPQAGQDMAAYTGSTTGTSRDNSVCSGYSPITWQVDRTCHLISASTFDKMCADMKQMGDDMSMDLHPHGARELVTNGLAANNLAAAESQQFLR